MSSAMSKLETIRSNSNLYSNLFSSSGGSSNSSSTSILSSNSFSVSDYSLIKSGSYKKLLKAYYNTQEDSSTSSSALSTLDGTSKLAEVKGDAQALNSAANALNDSSLYKSTGIDSDGNREYDRDAIKEAVKNYVDTYNSYIESSSDLNSNTILRSTLRMVNSTAQNAGLLKDVGINIGSNNKLTIDETQLDKADISTLKTLFTGNGSYGNTIASKASESYRVANSNLYSNTHGLSYSFSGSYSMLGSTSSFLDGYI